MRFPFRDIVPLPFSLAAFVFVACASEDARDNADLGAGLRGCPSGADCVLEADDYDRACTSSSDCVTVFVGDLCRCDCEQVSSVSKRGREDYGRDRGAVTCENACKPCADVHAAACVAGKCEAQRCPGPVQRCATACDEAATVTACVCPAGMVDTGTCP